MKNLFSFPVSKNREAKYHQSRRRGRNVLPRDDTELFRPRGRREAPMMSKDDSVLGSRRLLGPTGIATMPSTSDYPPRYRRDRPHSTSSLGR